MAVAFNNMPGDVRVPGQYAEINSGIPPYTGKSRTILFGRKLPGGTAAIGKPVMLSGGDPTGLFGAGAMLTDEAIYARWRNPNGEIWAFPVTDPVGAVAATGTVAITGTATSAGTYTRYVAGERYDIPVAYGDTAATVALNLVAAVGKGYSKYNRRMLSCVTGAAATGTATFTARHAGSEGNGIRIETGLSGDENEVPGITDVITAMSGGVGEVDMGAALAALGPKAFHWMLSPYGSVTQLNAVQTFLSDSGFGTWSPLDGRGGHYITANDGNLSGLTTIGANRNDRHASILGRQNYPHPSWCWVAALGSAVAFSKNFGRALTEAVEIARPLQTITLDGLRAPKALSDQWGPTDRDALYRNGLSAVTFAADGTPIIDRVLTTYQTGPFGVSDITFLGIETIAIAYYVKEYFKYKIALTYPRHVLRDDNPSGQQGVATPDQIRATCIHAYTDLSDTACLVENKALFAKYLIVERSADPNRVNIYLPTDVANQLVVVAMNITIFPQLTDTIASLQ